MEREEKKKDIKTGKICKFITFGLDRERFGIPIQQVREIIADYNIVPLPKAPDFIEGIISLRGDIIPIVEMRRRFDMEERTENDETRIIVIEMRDFSVGIQVDKVYEVLKLSEGEVDAPPKLVAGLKADYLAGVAEVNDRLTIILNLEEIFSTHEKLVIRETVEPGEGVRTDFSGGSRKETPSAAAPRPERISCTVSPSGQISIRGKEYYVGKKYAGNEAAAEETERGVAVFVRGEKIKEFAS